MDQITAHDAGYAFGTLLGYLLIYGGLLALGLFFGKRLGRKREDVPSCAGRSVWRSR